MSLPFRLQTSCKLQRPCNSDCKPPANCSDLAIPFANLLQIAATLQFRLQNFLQIAATLQSRLQTSCKLRQTYNSDCKPPANCGKLANPFADLLQIAANLQTPLQTSCKLRQTCKPLCRPPANCSDLTNPFADLLQTAANLQTPLQTCSKNGKGFKIPRRRASWKRSVRAHPDEAHARWLAAHCRPTHGNGHPVRRCGQMPTAYPG